MEIERINENTIKFYISYVDIEERGFDRVDLWHDREQSEQLFWKLMEEVNHKEEFVVEGPVWIQIQALEKGLEVIVTKTDHPDHQSDSMFSSATRQKLTKKQQEDYDMFAETEFGKALLEGSRLQGLGERVERKAAEVEKRDLTLIVKFNDFEDLIQLSHAFNSETTGAFETLYHYQDHYYLTIEFARLELDLNERDDLASRYLEYATEASETSAILEAYGKQIKASYVLKEMKKHFPQ